MNDRLLVLCYLVLAVVGGLLLYNIERVRFDYGKQVLRQDGLVMVVWEADWCPSCQRLRPVLEQIKAERTDLTVVRIDIDTSRQLWQTHGSCRGIPCIVFIRDGRYLSHSAGFQAKPELERRISRHLPMEI